MARRSNLFVFTLCLMSAAPVMAQPMTINFGTPFTSPLQVDGFSGDPLVISLENLAPSFIVPGAESYDIDAELTRVTAVPTFGSQQDITNNLGFTPVWDRDDVNFPNTFADNTFDVISPFTAFLDIEMRIRSDGFAEIEFNNIFMTNGFLDLAGFITVTPNMSSGLAADFDMDGDVDLTDFNILAANFGLPGPHTQASGDADGDGDVDLTDFNILAATFGFTENEGSPANLPEPGGLFVVGVLALGMSRRVRGR